MTGKPLKLGMIGLDTSHVAAFASILNNPEHPYHVPGGTIQVAYPGVASRDFELSWGRVAQYTGVLRDTYNVQLLDSEQAVAEQSDAILIVSVDGRVHLEQFRQVVQLGKPVFVDKPFTTDYGQAVEMFALAEKYGVPLMSCSSLRYAEPLVEKLGREEGGAVIGFDCYGPMSIEEALPGLFWYGIHTIEMAYRAMGRGCVSVTAATNDYHDVIVGVWRDGRMATIRGNRKGNYSYGALIHREQATDFVDVASSPKPYYAGMLEAVIGMFRTGDTPIDPQETLEIIRFIECANESRRTGATVRL